MASESAKTVATVADEAAASAAHEAQIVYPYNQVYLERGKSRQRRAAVATDHLVRRAALMRLLCLVLFWLIASSNSSASSPHHCAPTDDFIKETTTDKIGTIF